MARPCACRLALLTQAGRELAVVSEVEQNTSRNKRKCNTHKGVCTQWLIPEFLLSHSIT